MVTSSAFAVTPYIQTATSGNVTYMTRTAPTPLPGAGAVISNDYKLIPSNGVNGASGYQVTQISTPNQIPAAQPMAEPKNILGLPDSSLNRETMECDKCLEAANKQYLTNGGLCNAYKGNDMRTNILRNQCETRASNIFYAQAAACTYDILDKNMKVTGKKNCGYTKDKIDKITNNVLNGAEDPYSLPPKSPKPLPNQGANYTPPSECPADFIGVIGSAGLPIC